jgi:hypothetical protein
MRISQRVVLMLSLATSWKHDRPRASAMALGRSNRKRWPPVELNDGLRYAQTDGPRGIGCRPGAEDINYTLLG